MFWTSEGYCDDGGYTHVLYGKSIQDKLCSLEDSFVGPLPSCEPAFNEMFETILQNLDQPNLGLGTEHTVTSIFQAAPVEDQN